ncbi:hypothetical protein J7E28_10020 [Microbacterium sp. ISL-108]|nr:hypothetical protein [Microbacterium sp. ISL-108]RKN67885.1 hypothetical protein D7252_09990 [Microbacterium sp. CGR2]
MTSPSPRVKAGIAAVAVVVVVLILIGVVAVVDNQAAWGEAEESRADVFRGFAEDLDLDLEAYDRAVADPATAERVEVDVTDGRALGVDSTPTSAISAVSSSSLEVSWWWPGRSGW